MSPHVEGPLLGGLPCHDLIHAKAWLHAKFGPPGSKSMPFQAFWAFQARNGPPFRGPLGADHPTTTRPMLRESPMPSLAPPGSNGAAAYPEHTDERTHRHSCSDTCIDSCHYSGEFDTIENLFLPGIAKAGGCCHCKRGVSITEVTLGGTHCTSTVDTAQAYAIIR